MIEYRIDNYMEFSVLISTYQGDDPAALDKALESVYSQSRQPDEVILVEDGDLTPELRDTIDKWSEYEPIPTTNIKIDVNRGLGNALSIGLNHCTYDIVARMDSDDIAVPDRFVKQTHFLQTNHEVAVVGGYMREIDSGSDRSYIRKVPTDPEQIRSRAKFRSPLNHPTVMFRKEAVKNVGSYRDLRSMQDYELWVRLLNEGYTLANIPEVLVETNIKEDLYERRGGLQYGALEYRLQSEFLRSGFISFPVFVFNLLTRVPIRLLPNILRKNIYKILLRK